MKTAAYFEQTTIQTVQLESPEFPALFDAIVLAPPPGISHDDVCGLLAAAGSLSVEDIAGGLNVAASDVAPFVSLMAGSGDIRADEFGRYRLSGECPGWEL